LVNWASDARQHAITQAQRRKKGEGNPLVPLGGTPEYTGYARDPRDRSRTHFKDLSSSHPNNPTFSKLASQEDSYWKSGAWIPDAGLKTDTSIEETIGLVTGIPSLARLGATGVRAAVGSGRQALANRGVGGWTKVMDPGRREFMKVGAGLAAATVVPPKILMDVLGGAAKKAAPAAAAAVTPYADSAAVALYKKIARQAKEHGEFLLTDPGPEFYLGGYHSEAMKMSKDFFIKDISRKGATRKEIQTATREYRKGLQESQREWTKEAKVWTDMRKELIDVRGDLPHTTLPLSPPGTPGRLRYPDGKRVPHIPGGGEVTLKQLEKDPLGPGRITFRQQRRVADTIGRTEELARIYKNEAAGVLELMREIPTLRRTARESLRVQRTQGSVSGLTPNRPGTTMSRPRHGGGTVPIKIKPGGPSPSSPRPGRRNRTRTQKAIESYQESLRNRNRR